MKICQFNFNNEVDAFEIHVEDDGHVTVPGEDGAVLAAYDSVQQLAEIYAQARGVKSENLKNWTLLENGSEYTFVLRAGTAGVSVADAYDRIEAAIDGLVERHHALSIARAKEQILGNGDADLTEALVHCTETEIARDVYDALLSVIDATDADADEEPSVVAVVDERSDLEKYVDEVVERTPGALRVFALLAQVPDMTDKADVVAALSNSLAFRNVDTLRNAYSNAISDIMDNGIGVATVEDAITVLVQAPVGKPAGDEMKRRLVATVRMAGRDRLNISVDIVGHTSIRHTATIVPLEEVEAAEMYVRGNTPYIVRFDDTVDAQLEAERYADEEDEGYDEEEYEDRTGRSVSGRLVRDMVDGRM